MIFLDTGYFIGLMDEKDDNHDDAMEIENYLNYSNEPTVVNTTVLVETLNRSAGSREDVKQLWNDIYLNNIVIQLSDEDYLKSLEINGWLNNSINYSDCTIIQTMMSVGINRIVSFDSGFEKIGRYQVISSM
ncbi:type II toxin-antitoxin system VapC family toxin [Methanobrevibacter sp.]